MSESEEGALRVRADGGFWAFFAKKRSKMGAIGKKLENSFRKCLTKQKGDGKMKLLEVPIIE